ncbi:MULTISPECIES: serine hydrolase domain-containing protein [Sphingobium]|jgi:CubicO group peptidase (beta-lactamase class C family)|uniref:Penicillin-binding protein n=3 Tax=Sphingobium TaxID=165695 RepID=A0A0J9FS64_SPHYA|nr:MULTISPECIES: serine hydrolase domain-containing protein [Sphingobium]ATP20742.1 penicillin-binding protein [Sphingobium yanoikuyae]KMW31085.1 penicillin-binding protein [Sphingobium yanoikuyae]TKV41317.1 penicillin-binding protein [Sphingobium sp. MP9-4]
MMTMAVRMVTLLGFLSILSAPAVAADARKIDAAIPEIDRLFADFQVDSHAPGLVYGIVSDGRLVHVKGFGAQDLVQKRPVTGDSLFRIASMTKAFTALSILKLREEGKLSLDDLAETYVPEMRGWTYATKDSPRIRIRDLLTHSAGFVDDNPWGDRQTPLPDADFTRMLEQGVPMSSAPATHYEYSNFGYALLGRIIANVSGMPYRRYVEQSLLTPLGMTSSGYQLSEWPAARRSLGYRWEDGRWKREPDMADGAFGAMGGLQTSANDYARWVAFLLSAWPPRDDAESGPVSRASVRMLAEGSNFMSVGQRNGKSGATACRQAAAYGFAMRIAQDCDLGLTLSHGGGYPGYGSHVMLMPDYGVGIFVFTNRTYNGGAGAAWDAAMLLQKAGALIARDVPVSPLLAQGYAAAGRIYASGDVLAARDNLAMNFLMDADAVHWGKRLAALKGEVGSCAVDAPLSATGNLSGKFTWTCEKGRVAGSLLLAPTADAEIQELKLEVKAP